MYHVFRAAVHFSRPWPLLLGRLAATGKLTRAIDDRLVYHALNRAADFAAADDHLAFLQSLAAAR